jgi:tetratricopeptide (TPR) repeat protein
MPEYYLTSRTPSGFTRTECVVALSADAAVERLRERGHTDIVLHTDEVGAQFPMPLSARPYVSPREYVGYRHNRGYFDRALHLTLKLYKANWLLMLMIASLLAMHRYLDAPLDWYDGVGALILASPLLAGPILTLFNPVLRYNELIEAVSWGRWEDVLELLPGIEQRVRPHEGAFRRAQALAGLGRLDEAVAVVERYSDGREIPLWLFYARLATVYQIGGDVEQSLDLHECAVEAAPEIATVLVDTAFAVLRHRRDTYRAALLLEQARAHAVSDLATPFLRKTEGLLALERGKAAEALQLFEESIKGASAFLGNPLVRANIDVTHSLIALAHVALGDREAADRHFRQAEPRLRALRYDDLLTRCAKAGLQGDE